MAQKPHEPTELARRTVEAMSGYGIKQEVICSAINVSLPTLHKYYRFELDQGDAQAQAKIGQALYQKAIQGDTTALIFLAKTRLGFREVSRIENTGADGGPIQVEESPRERITRKLAGLKVVGGTDADS